MKKSLIFLFCLGMIASLIQFSPVIAETVGYNTLNNGYIQFSDSGTSSNWRNLPNSPVGNAVNQFGNLNNPYYYDGTVWRPLTLFRKMEYALSEGGSLVSTTDSYVVSGAGPIIYPASSGSELALTDFSVDGSGITRKIQETTAGSATYTGTLVSKGDIIVNGKSLEIQNTYTLLEGKSFVRVKTKITNNATLAATNVRYWVGTGDDWIGLDDSNYKTRGNIADGAFSAISVPSAQAKAIRVDSRSLTESILFYSTHPNANTSVASCCSFSNAVNTNPVNSVINILNDGSYALFVNLGTIEPGASAEFDWYYAAGSAATIIDTISDVALDSAGTSQITWGSATVSYSSPTTTTGYYMVLPGGSTRPTINQIIGDEEYSSVTVVKRDHVLMEAGADTPIDLTGLNPNSQYDVYFVTRDSEGVTSSVSKTTFTTLAYTVISLTSIDSIDVPMNHRIPDSSEIETAEYTATVEWSPSPERFVAGQTYTATITVTPKLGYTLTGIGANAFTVTGASEVTNNADSGIITVTYPEVAFDKVNFHTNGGSIISSLGVDFGDLVTKPVDPTLNYHDFIGWFTDNITFEDAWDFANDTMPEGDIDLYAKWSLTTYQINYELDGGVNFVEALSTYNNESSTINLGTPTKNGYVFEGWYENADKETGGIISSIPFGSSGDKTFYAKWSPTNYIINYELDGGVNFLEAPGSYTIESSTINLGTPTRKGYIFEGWYENADKETGGIISSIPLGSSGNKTFYAKWTPTTYQITYELDGGVNFVDAPSTYTIESPTISLQVPTRNGYIFEGWFENEDKETGGIISSIPLGSSGAKTLYAKWSPISVTHVSADILNVSFEGMAEGVPFTSEELEKEIYVQLVITIQEMLNLDVTTKSILDRFIAANFSEGVKDTFLLDISLFKWVGEEKSAVTSTTSMTKISFIVPEKFRNQEFVLVRVHEGVAEKLQYTYNPETYVISFETDRFSTYSLMSWSTSLPNAGENSSDLTLLLLALGVFLLFAIKNKHAKEIK